MSWRGHVTNQDMPFPDPTPDAAELLGDPDDLMQRLASEGSPYFADLAGRAYLRIRMLQQALAELRAAPPAVPVAGAEERHGVAIWGDYGVTCSCTAVLDWPAGWSRNETAAGRLVASHVGECPTCHRLRAAQPEDDGLDAKAAVMKGWAAPSALRPATPWLSLSVALAILKGTHPALAQPAVPVASTSFCNECGEEH
jgi:hypothetical protein